MKVKSQGLSPKKIAELYVAERYLPHLNYRNRTYFRVNYQTLLNRSENTFPDIEILDLRNPQQTIELEITRGVNTQISEERDGLQSEFFQGVTSILSTATMDNKPIKAFVSVSINRNNLSKKNIRKEIMLLKKTYQKIYKESLLSNFRSQEVLKSNGFEIIDDLTIEDSIFPIQMQSWWGESDRLDPFEIVINAYTNKKAKIADPSNTILVVTIDEDINSYYWESIASYFRPLEVPFKELVIMVNHKYGNLFFISNESLGKA